MRAVPGRLEEAALSSPDELSEIRRRTIEQPVMVDVAVDILERSGKAALDETLVGAQRPCRVRRRLRPDEFGCTEPVGGEQRQHAWTLQAFGIDQRLGDGHEAIRHVAARLADRDVHTAGSSAVQVDAKLDLHRTD